MLNQHPMRRAVLLALYGASALAPSAFAQTATPDTAAVPSEPAAVQSVHVVGTRRTGATSSTDTPVPVDIIPMTRLAEQGSQFDLAQTLTNISPSFNSTRQSGADGADLVDSAALRGLGSDQTLVLVNGKRRHTTALVNLFGARNRGNTGTDMNAIPLLAIRNVQVLRDGAAAQYGSDAIAGVMNIELKKSLGCEAVAGYGQYKEGDGENYLASAYCGVAVGGGTFGVTGEYLSRGRSNRAEEGNPRIIGDSKTENQTVYINGDIPVGAGRMYMTLGVQRRDASSAAFARGGVGSDDIPSRNSAAMYPNGFVPFIDGDLDDRYGTVGFRTSFGDWNGDFSQTYGYNRLDYTIANTLNASIANRDLERGGRGVSASSFAAGGFDFRQLTTNADFSRYYGGVFNGLNAAFGFEHRRENYKIFAG
ncbi:MAG: TonB-dependent receptor plug domain-containing protein, partial [Telluria sp.]